MKSKMYLCLALALATCVAGAARAQVRDDGNFFSPQAIDRANESIRQMKQQTGRDLLIETFPAVPQERQGALRSDNQADFFRQWANDRGAAAHVKGVYVLINRSPSYLLIKPEDRVKQREFTEADSKELRDQMLPLMKQKQFDEALNTAVDFVSTRFKERVQNGTAGTATQVPPPPPSNTNYPTNAPSYPNSPPSSGFHIGGLLFLGIIVIGGLMFLRRIFGGRSAGYGRSYGAPFGGGYGPGYGGGGGFGRGILGGILGGMAGGWLQNRMSNRNSGSFGAPPPVDSGGSFGNSSNDVSFTGGGDAGGSFDSGPSDSGSSGDGSSGGSF